MTTPVVEKVQILCMKNMGSMVCKMNGHKSSRIEKKKSGGCLSRINQLIGILISPYEIN